MTVLVQFFLAHLLGDFLLQTKAAVHQKESRKWAAPFLYVHALIHLLLLGLATWNLALWLPCAIIAAAHLVIDGLKLQLQRDENRVVWFFADQALHAAAILLAWYFFASDTPSASPIPRLYLFVITGGFFLTQPAGIGIGMLLSKWSEKIGDAGNDSLPNGGRYIGMLERLLTFVFVLTGHWAAIGFLLAAKSIFRFGDLTRAKDRKLTEYILVGTLLSFGIAIGTGIAVVMLIGETLLIP